jgi:hypothetical protein
MWSTDIENVLERIRQNAVIMSLQHKRKYFRCKEFSSYFRIPTIVLSGINSVSSVGLQNYINQTDISAITCLISLVISVINSMELYLKLQETIDNELEKSKQYYNLSTDIFKVLSLDTDNRPHNAIEILEEFYKRYTDLYEQSNLLLNMKDIMIELPVKKSIFSIPVKTNSSSSSSASSTLSENEQMI